MIDFPYYVVTWLFLVGIYGIVSTRNIIHLVGSLLVMQSSTYVLLVVAGYRRFGTAPVLKDVVPGSQTVDPVVQALTLTDIVVGATVSALILVFAVQVHKKTKSENPEQSEEVRG